jgi:cell division protease FtsH
MVMEFGMSRLGRVNYRESGRSPFLGAGGDGLSRDHSEETAREIDEEVKRIIDDAGQLTKQILTERREALESVTQRLIEIEVMDSVELARLIDDTLPGPRVAHGTLASGSPKPPAPSTVSPVSNSEEPSAEPRGNNAKGDAAG